MKTMFSQSRKRAALAALAACMLPVTAQAQYGSSPPPPLYPYVMQGDQPYAVEVAPGTYVIKRPARDYPYVRNQNSGRGVINTVAAPSPGKFDRPHKPVDHALVEELRSRHKTKDAVNTTKIVRDAPVVVEHQRIVDDPPRVVTRRNIIEDQPDGSQTLTVEDDAPPAPRASRGSDTSRKRVVQSEPGDANKKRVIQADAEVTILGPDRMSIRLFRKGQGPKANARAD